MFVEASRDQECALSDREKILSLSGFVDVDMAHMFYIYQLTFALLHPKPPDNSQTEMAMLCF